MHCGVMVTGYNQGDWPRLMAEEYDRPPDVPDAKNLDDTLYMGEMVEPLGFDSIWATEHYGSAYSMQPNPLQYLAFWAGRTRRVDVGTAVIVAPWWNPVRLASELSMLDILLQGRRLHLGIGRGIAPHEYASLGYPIEQSHKYFYDVINAIKASDGAERFEFKGEVYDIPPTTIRPQARHKGELTKDIKVAFTTEASARMAAENGLGQMFVAGDDVDVMTDKVRRFNTIRRELSLPPDQPTTLLWMYCAETSEEAEGGVDLFPQSAQRRRSTITSSGTIRDMRAFRAMRNTWRARPPTLAPQTPASPPGGQPSPSALRTNYRKDQALQWTISLEKVVIHMSTADAEGQGGKEPPALRREGSAGGAGHAHSGQPQVIGVRLRSCKQAWPGGAFSGQAGYAIISGGGRYVRIGRIDGQHIGGAGESRGHQRASNPRDAHGRRL